MDLYRDDKIGFWKLEATEEERELKPDYIEALPRYLNGLDSIFARAQQQDEAQLVLSLLGIKGMQAEGWDPYDTTVDAIRAATHLHNETEDRLAARHFLSGSTATSWRRPPLMTCSPTSSTSPKAGRLA